MPLQENTIVIDQRDGMWRMRVWPDQVQFFGTRESAQAHAQDLACSKTPRWTVIVRDSELESG